MFRDLREFITKADEIGECRLVQRADWNLEIGAITNLQGQLSESPLLLFDNIKGYPRGYRVVSNLATNAKRIALCFDLPAEGSGLVLCHVGPLDTHFPPLKAALDVASQALSRPSFYNPHRQP
jgi:3-polyprenyl-4-hydroxybenzoate decarboxylase